jgi:uncharacterized membrane protein YagU involved in acid resistance
VRAIVHGGVAAGVLDILAAVGLEGRRGTPPGRVLQYIASGVLGRDAFQGGAATAAVGLLLHFVIAFGAAAVYVAASRRLPVLVRQAVAGGLAYGVIVYLVMSQFIVPLSRVVRPAGAAVWNPTMIVVHMLCVGLPIAIAARLQSRR